MGVDDDIRYMALREFKSLLQNDAFDEIPKVFSDLKYEMTEMITKEDPPADDHRHLHEDHWLQIAKESEEIGYCIVKPESKWISEQPSNCFT